MIGTDTELAMTSTVVIALYWVLCTTPPSLLTLQSLVRGVVTTVPAVVAAVSRCYLSQDDTLT